MNDRDLDKKLQVARHQSDKFFNKFNFGDSRKIVHRKIEDNKNINLLERILGNRIWLKGALVTCMIALIFFVSHQMIGNKYTDRGTPVLQQAIELDNNKNNHLVNYFRVDNPNEDNNLLAVLWEKDLEGNYDVIYSSMMENTDIPNPVAIMNVPYSDIKFALVSSRNKNKNYTHYRLIRYSNNSAKTYLEDNYIPEGKIEINNGMLVEERTVPNDYYLKEDNRGVSKSSKVYRYYVPMELMEDGSLNLTAKDIILKKGAILTLLYDYRSMPLEFEYDNHVLRKSDEGIIDNKSTNSINFQMKEKGFVNLKIIEKNNINKANELFIKIVD